MWAWGEEWRQDSNWSGGKNCTITITFTDEERKKISRRLMLLFFGKFCNPFPCTYFKKFAGHFLKLFCLAFCVALLCLELWFLDESKAKNEREWVEFSRWNDFYDTIGMSMTLRMNEDLMRYENSFVNENGLSLMFLCWICVLLVEVTGTGDGRPWNWLGWDEVGWEAVQMKGGSIGWQDMLHWIGLMTEQEMWLIAR